MCSGQIEPLGHGSSAPPDGGGGETRGSMVRNAQFALLTNNPEKSVDAGHETPNVFRANTPLRCPMCSERIEPLGQGSFDPPDEGPRETCGCMVRNA